jgi:hypothetical protein
LVGIVAVGVSIDACNKQSVTVNLRSLQDSTEVTFVCRGKTDQGDNHGLAANECPDLDNVPPNRVTLALITQVTTNELAVVDVVHQKVVDVDPAVPGYTFLRLPSRPGAITSTPGGEASFVGLTSPGKTGISAIPTTCLGAPEPGSRARDLTSFAACGLSSTPGDMVVVVEPPNGSGDIAATCAGAPQGSDPPPGAGSDRDCPSNLTTEHGPAGRRKLVVALPEEGKLAVLDAQALLDRAPGSFDPCDIELLLDLDASPDTSGQAQIVPPDLENGCTPNRPASPPTPPSGASRPSGMSLSGDDKLYVGDLGVAAVHVIDATSICAPHELAPLLPMAFTDPTRVVTTSHVAVSPVTPSGHQYVYAVDASDRPTSVMAFDVTPGNSNRTPIVRDGSARQPREVPDRLSFAAPVQDVDFAYRDLPREDPTTGVGEIGVECDPNPDAPRDPASPGVLYRTTGDYTQGARPHLLRGLFGLALLTSGQVIIIDLDDFDAPCRRPYTTNSNTTEEDFRGCIGDTLPYTYLTYDGSQNGTKTVSDEVSCNMVEPNRPRAAAFGLSLPTLGVGAPSLRGLPLFQSPPSVTNIDAGGRPKLLAVPFKNPGDVAVPPVTYVGTTLYSTTNASAALRVDPNDSNDVNALALPLYEPRAYSSSEHVEVTYEGRVFAAAKLSGFLHELEKLPDGQTRMELDDATAFFCDNGVYDPDAMTDYATNELGIKAKSAPDFAATHSDYVQITGDFPDILDVYWRTAPHDRGYCIEKFGPPQRIGATDLQTELQASRDLDIKAAYQDHLEVTPRLPASYSAEVCNPPSGEAGAGGNDSGSGTGGTGGTGGPSGGGGTSGTSGGKDVYCPPKPDDFATCFPTGIRYTVRGADQWVLLSSRPEATYDIIADPNNGYRCVRDCDRSKQYFRNRVFEIGASCGNGPCGDNVDVGGSTPDDGPCVYNPLDPTGATRGVGLDDGAAVCIFENLTARFSVYRGLQPSVRGMRFSWDTTGGFYPLVGALTAISSATLPQRVRYVPEYQSIAVVDSASLGLSFMSLDTLQVISPWPVY